MNWFRTVCAVTPAVLAACSSNLEVATCDRGCLVDAARAIALGSSAPSSDARVTENGAEMSIDETWLKRAHDVDIHGEYADEATRTAIVIGTGRDDDDRPTVFGLRVLQEANASKEVELIMTHDGEVSLFPPAIPLERQSLFSQIVPQSQRTPGKRMIEIANAYFDGIEVDSGKDVPVTDDCNRIENGVQTTNSERFPGLKCNSLEGFDYITEVRERRFPIVDEERGIVAGLVAFFIPGGDYKRVVDGMETMRHYDPRSLFLIEGFKIEAGKARLIQATMRNMPLGTSMGWSD
jgi:hypothetical protein